MDALVRDGDIHALGGRIPQRSVVQEGAGDQGSPHERSSHRKLNTYAQTNTRRCRIRVSVCVGVPDVSSDSIDRWASLARCLAKRDLDDGRAPLSNVLGITDEMQPL